MKRSLYILLVSLCLAGLLTGCRRAPAPEEAAPSPSQAVLPPDAPADGPVIPLDPHAQAIQVPDFLDEAQQLLYRQANSLYGRMFGGSTIGVDVDLFGPSEWEPFEQVEVTLDSGSVTVYTLARGLYRNWADFDRAVHSVFTDAFWDAHNNVSPALGPLYREVDGRLGIIDAGRGCGYYWNHNFPDEFRLEEKTEDLISFTVIGHYTPVWPLEGESPEERDARRAASYDYTLEFPIRMVRTGAGWRLDEFHSTLFDEEAPEELP